MSAEPYATPLADLPYAWCRKDEIRRRIASRPVALFLDYDGTLTPIVAHHARALLDPQMRDIVARLAARCPVTIVSGRGMARLREVIALDTVFLAGSHGFEIAGAEGSGMDLEKGGEFLERLDAAEARLREGLAGIEGHAVERKKYSIAVHYRNVAPSEVDGIEGFLATVLDEKPRLHLGHGKKVFELRPDIDWHKGEAVRWILSRLAETQPGIVPIYLGDDITDEDAFRALAGHGIRIAVRHDETRATAADYTLADTDDVRRFLEWLDNLLAGSREGG